jgi:hypothetical protein
MTELIELNARIKALESEVRNLKAQATDSAAPRAPTPRPPLAEEGLRITFPPPSANPHFEMPSASELRELYRIALTAAPHLAPSELKADSHFFEFMKVFAVLGSIGRGELDTRRYLGFWCDLIDDRLRASNGSSMNFGGTFWLAMLASGDISYCNADGSQGVLAAVGLRSYGGRQAKDAWREVLAAGRPMAPTTPAGRYGYASQRASVTIVG